MFQLKNIYLEISDKFGWSTDKLAFSLLSLTL